MDVTSKVKGTLITRKDEFTFEYSLFYYTNLKYNAYVFNIWKENDGIDPIHRFNFSLQIMENGTDLKVVDLYAHKYEGKGISIAIILKSKELFKKRIISSSNKMKSNPGEQNKPEAIEKIWKPLVNQGLAKYNKKGDYYYVL